MITQEITYWPVVGPNGRKNPDGTKARKVSKARRNLNRYVF